MAEDTDYEFIPKQSLDDMKKQLAELQKQSQQKEKISIDQFSQAIANLTRSMEEMNVLFKAATEELKLEETTKENISQYVEPINNRLDSIEEQNKKIADAMLALADMIDDLKKQKSSRQEFQPIPPMQQQMIRAPLPQMPREEFAPPEFGRLNMPEMPRPLGPLPPPPAPDKKKGLFSFKK